MRCKTCHYSLVNLTPSESGEHRCPECGTAFDPNDPMTICVILLILVLSLISAN